MLLYVCRVNKAQLKKLNIMNTFTITFKDALGELKTEQMTLDFVTVNGVVAWFLDVLSIRVISITKN